MTTYRIGNHVCILLGMVEARSVNNVKNTTTTTTTTSRLDKRVQIGNRVVGAIVLSPTDAASQGTCGGLGAARRSGTRAGST